MMVSALFDTKLTDYDVMNTPFHRDVTKELAEACRKQGIAFGTYYSVRLASSRFPADQPRRQGEAGKIQSGRL